MLYNEVRECRGCGKDDLDEVLSLGNQYIVDFPDEKVGQQCPLELLKCRHCALIQLRHTVDPVRLFRKFWYKSGINESMKMALEDIVKNAVNLTGIEPGETVLDIGCNDGTLLEYYPNSILTVGIDPAADLIQEAQAMGRAEVAVCGFFSQKAVANWAPYKIITAVAMFYDLDNPAEFLLQCKHVLDKNGLLVIQMNYLKTMLDNCTVDNISHEHLTYYSLTSLKPLVESVGLEILGAETNDVNGGSVRVYITHAGAQLNSKVDTDRLAQLSIGAMALEHMEQNMQLHREAPYAEFKARVRAMKKAVVEYIEGSAKMGKKIYVYGASTRGTALLQYLNHGTEVARLIQGAAERDERKYGKMMVGTWTPIFDEETCRKQAKVFLVLPYHFLEGIKRREEQWMLDGGELLVPLPRPSIVTAGGERAVRARTAIGIL